MLMVKQRFPSEPITASQWDCYLNVPPHRPPLLCVTETLCDIIYTACCVGKLSFTHNPSRVSVTAATLDWTGAAQAGVLDLPSKSRSRRKWSSIDVSRREINGWASAAGLVTWPAVVTALPGPSKCCLLIYPLGNELDQVNGPMFLCGFPYSVLVFFLYSCERGISSFISLGAWEKKGMLYF